MRLGNEVPLRSNSNSMFMINAWLSIQGTSNLKVREDVALRLNIILVSSLRDTLNRRIITSLKESFHESIILA